MLGFLAKKASDACVVFHPVVTNVRDRSCSWTGVGSSPSNKDVYQAWNLPLRILNSRV